MNNLERFKFRVYNHKTKSWVHGPGYETHLFGEMVLLGGFMREISIKDLNDCEIFQSTGFKDINGKEIFEGDIILGGNESKYIVKFGNYQYGHKDYDDLHCGFYLERLSEGLRFEPIGCACEFSSVIGNINENPSLIK